MGGKKVREDYYVGLDIGTNSIGWAVTKAEPSYKLCRFNGKDMWGVHVFEEGKNKEQRRISRTSRRRLQRRKQRIAILQELFKDEIGKVDPAFFIRLKESFFLREDKKIDTNFALFDDPSFTDKEYHKQYPTIHHLICELMKSDEPHDVRLVYLALAFLMSHRGHFLLDLPIDMAADITSKNYRSQLFERIRCSLNDALGLQTSCTDTQGFFEVMKDRRIGVNEKFKNLSEYLWGKVKIDQQKKAVARLLAGGIIKLEDMFGVSADDRLESDVSQKSKLSFSQGDFETRIHELEDELDGDSFALLLQLKELYDWSLLADILSDAQSISQAKVNVYEKHKKDLKELKEIVKKYCPERYAVIFKEVIKKTDKEKDWANYCAYAGKVKGSMKTDLTRASQEQFCTFLDNILSKLDVAEDDKAKYDRIMSEISARRFMPLQNAPVSSVIPHQLFAVEVRDILEKASSYLTFLTQKDEQDRTPQYKINKLFRFKIPYYVGPLNPKSSFAWLKRDQQEKVYPWNFKDAVDLNGSRENFIKRMTAKCSYLFGEDVMPKNSLLYSEFSLLNELNNLKINGEPLSNDIKSRIYEDLFIKPKECSKVTLKKVKDYLLSQNVVRVSDQIQGADDEIKTQLRSQHDFQTYLDKKTLLNIDVENIIAHITLLGKEKSCLKEWIKEEYGSKLASADIEKILRLNYSGWGRLSKKLLTGVLGSTEHSESPRSIIATMREENLNLQSLLSDKYDYARKIKELNDKYNNENTLTLEQQLDEMYVSNAARRQVYRTLDVMKDIVSVMGKAPQRIFIEMARGGQKDKKKTKSRKMQLLELYKDCKEKNEEWQQMNSSLNDCDEDSLRSDKIYLYYTQMGKSMYSGEPIDLGELMTGNSRWDVDHIYPQSKVKDDSLDNRVLVEKNINADKSDNFPLPAATRERNRQFWEILNRNGLISSEKLFRLTRSSGFSDDELAGFIARQLVETRQSTKAVAQLLLERYPECKIIYTKARLASEFRKQFEKDVRKDGEVIRYNHEFVKCRDVNDLHHAKDAYLNIVTGNAYYTKFTADPWNFIKNEGRDYSLKDIYRRNIKRGDTTAWVIDGAAPSITSIKKNMMKENPLYTRYAFCQHGALFDLLPMKKGRGQIRLKEDKCFDIAKYGGYNKATVSYFILVKHGLKERICSLEPVELRFAPQIGDDTERLQNYCAEVLKLDNPEVLYSGRKVKINTLFEINGFRAHLSGKTADRVGLKGAMQLRLGTEKTAYFKRIAKFVERTVRAKTEKRNAPSITAHNRISKEQNIELYDLFQRKLTETAYNVLLPKPEEIVKDGRLKFVELSVENQCQALFGMRGLFKCNAYGGADLRLIGGAERSGVLTMARVFKKKRNKSIRTIHTIRVIDQSATGLFEKQSENLMEM